MLNAIGSHPGSALPSAASLETRLTRYRQQLSDCVNCAVTSKTPQGQEAARSLSNKISEIKARLEEASISKASSVNPSADTSNSSSSADSNAQPGSTTATLGNYLVCLSPACRFAIPPDLKGDAISPFPAASFPHKTSRSARFQSRRFLL
jgi:hypothetical protein